MQWLVDTLFGGAVYDLFSHIVLGPLIVSVLGSAILRLAFHKLKAKRELFVFWGGSFLICLIVFTFLGQRPQAPNLVGSIQAVFSGKAPGNEHDTIAIFTVGIANTGSMQSIINKWVVEAEASGIKYRATFVPMPKSFTFSDIPRINEDQPESMTFKNEDNLLEKGLFPIQPGAFVQGLLFVVFRNVDTSIFKGVVDYTVNYQDILSKQYSMPIKSTGQIGQVPMMPGYHTELVCRAPSWTPSGPDKTGSLPPSHNFSPMPKNN